MYIVSVLTEWVSLGARNEMRVAQDYPASWSDVTGQSNVPPSPNLLIAEGVVSDELYATIEADLGDDVLTAGEIDNGT